MEPGNTERHKCKLTFRGGYPFRLSFWLALSDRTLPMKVFRPVGKRPSNGNAPWCGSPRGTSWDEDTKWVFSFDKFKRMFESAAFKGVVVRVLEDAQVQNGQPEWHDICDERYDALGILHFELDRESGELGLKCNSVLALRHDSEIRKSGGWWIGAWSDFESQFNGTQHEKLGYCRVVHPDAKSSRLEEGWRSQEVQNDGALHTELVRLSVRLGLVENALAAATARGEALGTELEDMRCASRMDHHALPTTALASQFGCGTADPSSTARHSASTENDDKQFRIRYQSRSKATASMLEQLEAAPDPRSSERRVED